MVSRTQLGMHERDLGKIEHEVREHLIKKKSLVAEETNE